jgi:hypothetical protein
MEAIRSSETSVLIRATRHHLPEDDNHLNPYIVARCRWNVFTPRERAPGTHWIGGWVDPSAGLDDVEKRKVLALQRLELRPFGRPASLYTD